MIMSSLLRCIVCFVLQFCGCEKIYADIALK
jgi:hypothetical protein